MNTYEFTFIGRTVGAIGIRYKITATRQGENIDDARLALYDEYDHISVIDTKIINSEASKKGEKKS